MKKLNIFFITVLVFVILGLFTACPDPNANTDPTQNDSIFTVTFNANGGTPAPKPQKIVKGSMVVMPQAMTKTGCLFIGWYKENSLTNEWDFSADSVTKNITLHAKWNEVPEGSFTVEFEANGGSPAPSLQTIAQGGKVGMPPAITKTGYVFGGWYKEADCTNKWDFNADTVSGNIKLYAKWNNSNTIPGETLAEKLQWLISNAENDKNYLLEVSSAHEALDPQNLYYAGRNNITIQLIGNSANRVIELSSKGSLFTITNGVTLILDNNITLIGRNDNDKPLITVNTGGTLIVNNGAKISGNTVSTNYTDNCGSGVYVGGGTFTMNGGEISGNTVSSDYSNNYGGGVYVGWGTSTMNGGVISGNTVFPYYSFGYSDCGGGVYVGGGTFTMSGGKISSNYAYSSGGGVYVGWSGTFTMSGGEISGNTSYYGGGVYVADGTITISGGEISGNFASNNGGGVYVDWEGTFTKSGNGIITGYADDTMNGNVVKDSSGFVQSNRGHAVYWNGFLSRDTTLGVNDNVSFSNFFSGATILTENSWEDGNIASTDDSQWFKFTATTATQYIYVKFGTLYDLSVQVYDSVGNAVGEQTDLYNSTISISMMVTSGQEYYVKVWSYYDSLGGTYQIAFNTTAIPPGTTVTTLTENTWENGNITSAGNSQWFKFTATAAIQYIHVKFGTLNNLYVQVYDSAGNAIGQQTYLSSYSGQKYISRTVTSGQEYYIKIWSYSSSYSGTYQIAFNTTVMLPGTIVTTLTANTWENGNITSSGDSQWFKFIATAATQYIHVVTLDSLDIQVYDSAGNAVEGQTHLTSGQKYISMTVTSGQEYCVMVWSYSSGMYQIAFNESATAP